MGLIKAAAGAAGGVLADQWKEYFYCEAMPADVLITKAHKKSIRKIIQQTRLREYYFKWFCNCSQ